MKYTFFREHESEYPKKSEDLLAYLEGFDPIKQKYQMAEEQFSLAIRAIATEYESAHQFGSLNKQEYSYIAENLKLVYGDSELIRDDIRAYHLTEKKIIHSYLGIPQLDKMFDEDYFNFEWDMHVGQNFSEHRNDYYRDHFIHQIRDMYMMLVLIEKFGFLDVSIECLQYRKNGKISSYTQKKHYAFINGVSDQLELLKRICKAQEAENPDAIGDSEYIHQWFYRYVIYASAMLAALFHDMGYPICHFLELRHRVSDYNPMMYMFTHNAVDSFDQIASKLRASLLFTIVSTHEIKYSLQLGKNGRYNHGAYSAVAFLLQFYENGMIYSLSPEKQCAIELAAVAIYNHTAKYNVIKYEEGNNYYSPVFAQNPVSFLLRFCDDLQEWDRRYFEISEASDLIFCPKCGVPLLRHNEDEKNEKSKGRKISNYSCMCKQYGKPVAFVRPDIFTKRKLFLVSVADRVSMYTETYDGENGTERLVAKIEYDLYTLLMLSYMNHTYAKYRAKELCELKRIMKNQEFSFQSNGCTKINDVRLDYFMSANPLLIKLKILEKYLRVCCLADGQDLIALLDKREPNILPKNFCNQKRKRKQLYDYLIDGKVLEFYCRLLKVCLQYGNERILENEKDKSLEEIKTDHLPDKEEDILYKNTLGYLIDDCVEQYKKEHDLDPADENSSYYKPYVAKERDAELYHSIAAYTESENAFNRYADDSGNSVRYVSFFTDMHLFYKMNELVKKELRNKNDLRYAT